MLYYIEVCYPKNNLNFVSTHLDSFSIFARGTIKEYLNFGSQLVKDRVKDNLTVIFHEFNKDFTCKIACYKTDDITIILISNKDFQMASFRYIINVLLKERVAQQFLDNFIRAYQNPKTFDKITRVQDEIAQVKEILINDIDKLLERGEKIEDLIILSQNMSDHAKLFAKRSKKLNEWCCTLL